MPNPNSLYLGYDFSFRTTYEGVVITHKDRHAILSPEKVDALIAFLNAHKKDAPHGRNS